MTDTHIIIYHAKCLDGTCSAALVNYFLNGDVSDKCFFPLAYGDGFDLSLIDKTTTVWILDFSFPIDMMWDINGKAKKVYWFDHRIKYLSSIQAFPDRFNNTEMMLEEINFKRCAASIIWDTLFSPDSRPLIIDIIEDYDIQRTDTAKVQFSKEYAESMKIELLDPRDSRWCVLFATDSDVMSNMLYEFKIKGEILLMAKKARVKRAIDAGYYGTIMGNRAFYVNASEDIEEIEDEIYYHLDPIVGVIYHHVGNDILKFHLITNCNNIEEIIDKFGGYVKDRKSVV